MRSAQKAARHLFEEGFSTVIFGEATHPEVKALVGWAGENAIATLGVDTIGNCSLPLKRLGVLSQTTQSKSQFTCFAGALLEIYFLRFMK